MTGWRLVVLIVTATIIVLLLGAGYVVLDTDVTRGQDGLSSALFLPMISTAPRLAETNAMPVTQAGSERAPVRNASEEAAFAFITKPTPITNAK